MEVRPSFRVLGFAGNRYFGQLGAYCIAHGKSRGSVIPHTPVTPLRSLQIFVPLDEPEADAIAHGARVAGYDPSTVRVTVLRRSLDARKGHPIGFRLEVAIWPADAPSIDGAGDADDEALPSPARARAGSHVIVV